MSSVKHKVYSDVWQLSVLTSRDSLDEAAREGVRAVMVGSATDATDIATWTAITRELE